MELVKHRLNLYLAAEEKILQGQSYTIDGRSLTRADLRYVQSMIESLISQLNAVKLKNGRSKRVVFVD